MRQGSHPWSRATIHRALLALELKSYTQAEGEVVLVSPPRFCETCRKRKEVMVRPGRCCSSCWSKAVLSKWQVVMPGQARGKAAEV